MRNDAWFLAALLLGFFAFGWYIAHEQGYEKGEQIGYARGDWDGRETERERAMKAGVAFRKDIGHGASIFVYSCNREVDCSGCKGTGKVTYGPDHEMVKLGFAEPGTYPCSYCGGSGKLIEEIRPR